MDREVAEQIRESRRKEKQDKHIKKTFTTLTTIKRMVERELAKQQRTNFIVVWSSSTNKHAKTNFTAISKWVCKLTFSDTWV